LVGVFVWRAAAGRITTTRLRTLGTEVSDNDAVDILILGRLSKANLECAQSDYNDPSYRLELVLQLETGLARPPGEWSFVGLGRHTLSLLWSHRCLLGEAENASKDRRKFLLTRSPPEVSLWVNFDRWQEGYSYYKFLLIYPRKKPGNYYLLYRAWTTSK
jgi:hypothetical protein